MKALGTILCSARCPLGQRASSTLLWAHYCEQHIIVGLREKSEDRGRTGQHQQCQHSSLLSNGHYNFVCGAHWGREPQVERQHSAVRGKSEEMRRWGQHQHCASITALVQSASLVWSCRQANSARMIWVGATFIFSLNLNFQQIHITMSQSVSFSLWAQTMAQTGARVIWVGGTCLSLVTYSPGAAFQIYLSHFELPQLSLYYPGTTLQISLWATATTV